MLLNLRSNDMTSIDDDGRYRFTLDTPIVAPANHSIEVSLMHAEIPNSFPNINTHNNVLSLSETVSSTTTNRSLTIPLGNYTSSTLKTAVLEQLNGAGSTVVYTMAFSNVTGKFTLGTATANASVVFHMNVSKSCRKALGFSGANHTLSTTTDLVSDLCVDLTGGNHSILVRSDMGGTNVVDTKHKGQRTTTLFNIPINAGNYDLILYEPPSTPFSVVLNRTIISSFYLRLTNQNQETLDFQGTDWSMGIRFTFKTIYDTHPIQQALNDNAYRRQDMMMSNDLEERLMLVSRNLHRIHEALPMLREGVMQHRDRLIADDMRMRQGLTEDFVST